MAIYASGPKRKPFKGSSGGSSSSSSSDRTMVETGTPTSNGRVAANSYENTPAKYEKDSSGGTYITSPSGKETYVDKDGNATILNSRYEETKGQTIFNDGTSTMDYAAPNASQLKDDVYVYRGEYDDVGNDAYTMQVEALQRAMRNDRNALQKSYDASEAQLNDAIAQAQREAYINQQRSLKRLPQVMAAAGYSGGTTESAAGGIMNDYQNALIELERSKAQELARLQANLANGIAESDTQYQIQLANALQAAEQFEAQQEQYAQELAMRQRAAALEEQRYNNSLALQREELQLARDKANQNNGLSNSEVLNLWKNGLINDSYATQTLGIPATAIATPQTTAYATPSSYLQAQQQAISANDMTPIAAYLTANGYSAAQIANRLNELETDPESAFYRYRR